MRIPYYCLPSVFSVHLPPPMALQPNAGHGLLILDEVSISHTTTHHSRYDSSGRVISSSQRPLPDNTQHSQQTEILAPGGIRTYNLGRRAAADLCLRPRGHWDRPSLYIHLLISTCGFTSEAEVVEYTPCALTLFCWIIHAAGYYSIEISERDVYSAHILYQLPDPKPLSSQMNFVIKYKVVQIWPGLICV